MNSETRNSKTRNWQVPGRESNVDFSPLARAGAAPRNQWATQASIPKMGKCYPITHIFDFCWIKHLYSQPKNMKALEIQKVSHGSHQSPQSHFAVPTIEGMPLGPSPVWTLACLAAYRAGAQKPPLSRASLACFFSRNQATDLVGNKRWGVRQMGNKATVRRCGEDENLAGRLLGGAAGRARLSTAGSAPE
jgi:hypothetical protein